MGYGIRSGFVYVKSNAPFGFSTRFVPVFLRGVVCTLTGPGSWFVMTVLCPARTTETRGTNRPPAIATGTGAWGIAGTFTPAGTLSRYTATLAIPPVLASTTSDSSGIGAAARGTFSILTAGGGPSNVMMADNVPVSPTSLPSTRSGVPFHGIPGINTASLARLVISERRALSGVETATACIAPSQVSAKNTVLSMPPNDGRGWRESNGISSGFVHGMSRRDSTASSVEPARRNARYLHGQPVAAFAAGARSNHTAPPRRCISVVRSGRSGSVFRKGCRHCRTAICQRLCRQPSAE